MDEPVKRTRAYHAPRRLEAAAQTRAAILDAAKQAFEQRGWAAATVRAVAEAAGVSPKTVEALFATKGALLGAVVDYAIRGDAGDVPIVRRPAGLAVADAPDAATLLDRHAAMVVAINARSARLAWAVDAAAPADATVAAVAERMRRNRADGARWAAGHLLARPGHRHGLTAAEAETILSLGIHWSTYRLLADERGLAPDAVVAWLRELYRATLLDPGTDELGQGATGA
jgi:AcrR family transcriptional regulator